VINISNRHDETISELSNKTIRERVKISNCTGCTIENSDISSNEPDHMFVLWNCQDCEVLNSKFHGKRSEGCAVKVDGDADKEENIPRGNSFEGCEWYDLRSPCEEPLRIGDSRRSHLSYDTTVSNCIFRDLQADEETISIKSCDNTIENCQHRNCKSSITIRHGHSNTIEGNTFIGPDGGIRVWGKDNSILGNTFKENSSDKHFPLRVLNGNTDEEPQGGNPHTAHAQVRDNEISGNTFDNCRKCVLWGGEDEKYKPTGVTFEDNKVIANRGQCVVIEFSGGATPEGNEFANNEVVGTKAIIDPRIAGGFVITQEL
jgi:parallel beta-helix repeat protein